MIILTDINLLSHLLLRSSASMYTHAFSSLTHTPRTHIHPLPTDWDDPHIQCAPKWIRPSTSWQVLIIITSLWFVTPLAHAKQSIMHGSIHLSVCLSVQKIARSRDLGICQWAARNHNECIKLLIDPPQGLATLLLVCWPMIPSHHWPTLAMITHAPWVSGKLPIKSSVARQWPIKEDKWTL